MYQVRGNRFYMYKNNKINERKVMLTHSGTYLSNSIAVQSVHNVHTILFNSYLTFQDLLEIRSISICLKIV